ncbi:MAG: PilZ domain-containing protein [Candidatus Scalinduaceae bacterium]
MKNAAKGIERRAEKRLELSLPMKLLDNKVKSKNISPGGVYFEVIANDDKCYFTGKTINIEIYTTTSTRGLPSKLIRLTGTGVVVRTEKINSNKHAKGLGVALKFKEKLKLFV